MRGSDRQVFVSCFNMFAHGSNDVANSIAPFAGTYLVWRSGSVSKNAPTPQWIRAVGGISMSFGLATYGYKVQPAVAQRSRGTSRRLPRDRVWQLMRSAYTGHSRGGDGRSCARWETRYRDTEIQREREREIQRE